MTCWGGGGGAGKTQLRSQGKACLYLPGASTRVLTAMQRLLCLSGQLSAKTLSDKQLDRISDRMISRDEAQPVIRDLFFRFRLVVSELGLHPEGYEVESRVGCDCCTSNCRNLALVAPVPIQLHDWTKTEIGLM